MRKHRRILSLTLALVLCLGLLPTAAMAAETAPLRNCRGATEVTCGSVTFHLSNPVLDVVELDDSSFYYLPSLEEDTSSKIVYIVPLGTEISWDKDSEEFSAYGYIHPEEIPPLFDNTSNSWTMKYRDPMYITLKRNEIVPSPQTPLTDMHSVGSSESVWIPRPIDPVNISFCGVLPKENEYLTLTENTEVDLTQFGPVVFSNVAAKKTISVDGETVPLYEIRPNSGFWKDFLGLHGTFAVYNTTVENDQLKKGAEQYSYDTHTRESGATNTISWWAYDSEEVGLYQFIEITGEPHGFSGPQPTLRFAIHVVSDQSTAYQSTQTVQVDGKAVEFQCYALKDQSGNPTNYIKLRDLADILNGSAAQFQVEWDGTVTITTKQAYTPNGSEGNTPFSGDRAYQEATNPTKVNGQSKDLAAFVLSDDRGGEYTYYQLRDLGKTLGFNVGWSADKGVFIETDKPYDPNN